MNRKRKKMRSSLAAVLAGAVLFQTCLSGAGEIDRAEPLPGDRPADLLGTFYTYWTLDSMERAGLLSGRMPFHPWSGDYWPVSGGLIARRYADPAFPRADWKTNNDWAQKEVENPSCSVERLSPAEKYDLLVGDGHRTLTRQMWEVGRAYQQTYGSVDSWMGICEGWSAASIAVARPKTTVTALAADGVTKIPFYPDDIKALASLLWARGIKNSVQVGHRCNDEKPVTDPITHRPINPDCFDNNPATWHLAVVHRIGAQHSGLIMDATWDAQVWNQPIYSYTYGYFNPKTGAPTAGWNAAVVNRSDWSADPYASTRSPAAYAIVGIRMDVDYAVETSASASLTDDPQHDVYRRDTYVYDLELDRQGRIIGGEWHAGAHPDFLWALMPGSHATSVGDLRLDRFRDLAHWEVDEPVPPSWRNAAIESSLQSQPLERIVRELVALSNIGRGRY